MLYLWGGGFNLRVNAVDHAIETRHNVTPTYVSNLTSTGPAGTCGSCGLGGGSYYECDICGRSTVGRSCKCGNTSPSACHAEWIWDCSSCDYHYSEYDNSSNVSSDIHYYCEEHDYCSDTAVCPHAGPDDPHLATECDDRYSKKESCYAGMSVVSWGSYPYAAPCATHGATYSSRTWECYKCDYVYHEKYCGACRGENPVTGPVYPTPHSGTVWHCDTHPSWGNVTHYYCTEHNYVGTSETCPGNPVTVAPAIEKNSLVVGETIQINPNATAGSMITYVSSDASKVSVSSDGLLTALEVGSSKITVKVSK